MDIQVPRKFIENICTVEDTVLIINLDNSDDPDLKKEDSSSETNPTSVEENSENDSKEDPNKEKDSDANKVADKPQCQQHRMDCASASVSKQCDTPSMKSQRKQDSSESDDDILYDSEDEDEGSDELNRKMMEIDHACAIVDQLKETVNLPRPHTDDLTLDEIEEQILAIELACSREEARAREENREPDLIRLHKYLTKHGQDMTPIARVSADVQNLISTETGSHDEDPNLPDRNHERHVSFHSLEPESGRVNPIPRHYYSEDSEDQKESKGDVKQDIPPRRDYRGLHRPTPVLATDHVMTHLRNIHEHDELRIDPLTTEGIQRPTNQIDGPENSANRLEVDYSEPEQQDNQTGNNTDPSPGE